MGMVPSRFKSGRLPVWVFPVLLAAAGLACALFPVPVAGLLQITLLSDHAESLVDASLERNMTSLMVVSVIKAGLGMVEGSTVGAGFFYLEVGDLVEPAYDYVNFCWNILLYAMVILGFYKVLLETGLLLLGVQLAGAGLVVVAGGLWWNRHRGTLLLGKRVLLAGILVAYVVPLGLLATEYLNHHFTEPYRVRYLAEMEQVKGRVAGVMESISGIKQDISITQPSESLDRMRQRLLGLIERLGAVVLDGFQAFLAYGMLMLLEVFLLPLLNAYLLYRFARFGLDHALAVPGASEGSVPMPKGRLAV
jgi:hypothetical protein